MSLTLLLSMQFAHAQNCNFIRHYFDYVTAGLKSFHAADLIHTSDNGYVLLGTMYKYTGDLYYFILKTNAAGDTLWYREDNSVNWSEGNYVIETSDSAFILTTLLGQYNLIKYDKNGNLIWERLLVPSTQLPVHSFDLRSVIEVNSSIYVFAVLEYQNGVQEGILFKTNLNGDSLMMLYNTPFLCGLNNHATLLYDHDKIAIAGQAYDSLNSYYVSKFFIIDTTGNVLHENVIQNQSEDFGFLLEQSHDSLFYFLSVNSLYKIDSLGNIVWFNDNVAVGQNYSLCVLDTDLILISTNSGLLGYRSSDGQSINQNYYLNCPFGIARYFVKAIVTGHKLILGGSAQDSSAIKYRCFIAEFDANAFTGISDTENKKHILPYPNPVRSGEKLIIDTQGMDIENLNVFDLMGRKIEQVSVPERNKITLLIQADKYSPGYYFVSMIPKNGLMIKGSFIVN